MNLNFELKLNTHQVTYILLCLVMYVLFDQIFNSQTWNLGVLLGMTIGSVFFLTNGDSKATSTAVVVVGHIFCVVLAASFAAPAGASAESLALGKIIFNVTVGSFLACLISWLISIGETNKEKVEETKNAPETEKQ